MEICRYIRKAGHLDKLLLKKVMPIFSMHSKVYFPFFFLLDGSGFTFLLSILSESKCVKSEGCDEYSVVQHGFFFE